MTNKPNLFINFLRSIAILLVFLGHYLELKFNLNNIAGVDIFFVLSGYLVSKSLFNLAHTIFLGTKQKACII